MSNAAGIKSELIDIIAYGEVVLMGIQISEMNGLSATYRYSRTWSDYVELRLKSDIECQDMVGRVSMLDYTLEKIVRLLMGIDVDASRTQSNP